jgi:hypothetical protein
VTGYRQSVRVRNNETGSQLKATKANEIVEEQERTGPQI